MKSFIVIATLGACVVLAAAYGKSGSANWNSYPILPMARPVLPPPPPTMPIVQEIYPLIPLIPEPVPQPLIFQHFGYQGDFMNHGGFLNHGNFMNFGYGNKNGLGIRMPLHHLAPLTGFGSGIGGGFRTGFMQDPWCDFGVFDHETPFYYNNFGGQHFGGFQQGFDNRNFGVVRRNEFSSQKFQPQQQTFQPTFQAPKFPVGPKDAGGIPINPNLS